LWQSAGRPVDDKIKKHVRALFEERERATDISWSMRLVGLLFIK